MPATDIRLAVGFPHHPKTQMLERRLGPDGPYCFIRLLLWCAQNKQDGDLADLSDEYIEMAAGYSGDPGTLVEALHAVGFIKGEESLRRINDWRIHQPWVATAEGRSAKARKAALKKWHGESKG